jgi:hypothetical protein
MHHPRERRPPCSGHGAGALIGRAPDCASCINGIGSRIRLEGWVAQHDLSRQKRSLLQFCDVRKQVKNQVMRWAFIASIEQVSERFAALSRAVKSG